MVQRTDRPPGLGTPGYLTFCTDIGYPPMEFYDEDRPTGADIEIGREIARRLGGVARFVDEPVVGIIDALINQKCDAVINAFTDNIERRQRVAFVDYLEVGQTVVVPRGNPRKIMTTEDLAGLEVLVQADTSNELSLRKLDAANQASGLPPMRIAAFKGTTGETVPRAAAALRDGQGHADFLDVINARWAARQPDVEVAPFVVNREPYGIAVRPEDEELQQAILAAVKSMYQDRWIHTILEGWALGDVAFSDEGRIRISH